MLGPLCAYSGRNKFRACGLSSHVGPPFRGVQLALRFPRLPLHNSGSCPIDVAQPVPRLPPEYGAPPGGSSGFTRCWTGARQRKEASREARPQVSAIGINRSGLYPRASTGLGGRSPALTFDRRVWRSGHRRPAERGQGYALRLRLSPASRLRSPGFRPSLPL
jgi:hypothetical protein